jgi:aminoglycoside phosphotransferase (APT) family kinase protein
MVQQPWSPEIVMTIEGAKKIIEDQFPQLKPVQISELGEGFDNTVYMVNGIYVFRFPRKEIAVDLLNIENKLLPLLVNDLSIRIPEPIFLGQPTEAYKWPFTGYHFVQGEAPGTLSEELRNQSAKLLGLVFKKLHRFPIEQAEKLGVPHDRFERMNLVKRKEMLLDKIKKAEELQFMEEAQTAIEWLNTMGDAQLETTLTLVHGDCHIRNILVDEKGVISGIIDWGDTHIGNPAIDLSIAYSFLTPNGRELFFQEYGEVSTEIKEAARFFALYVSVVLLLYGFDLKDEKLVASAKESIKLSLF